MERRLTAEIVCVISNLDDAPALAYARKEDIPTLSVQGHPPSEHARLMLDFLGSHGADFIALAGYMQLIPSEVITAFPHCIVNMHPALLPSFGGKGMYGHHVHEAVIDSGEKVTGATVHLVDEVYDRGPIVMQRRVPVLDDDTAETLAARVLEVEHDIYPEALQLFAEQRVEILENKIYIRT
jgi:phosphoribosylglycinamide formyltransferase-1